jgi:putative pyruvate formate lyase activating enzyme
MSSLGSKHTARRNWYRDCRVCPRHCGVDRLAGERGVCEEGAIPRIAAAHPHFGEEPVLVGSGGSGTIFFSSCNLKCVFCQNFDISHGGVGREVENAELAEIMLRLAYAGAENINLVSPTHFAPSVADAIETARGRGLHVPVVYNTGGYDSVEMLAELEGLVDIYMPDMKFSDPESGLRYTGVSDYPDINRAAVREMYRQVGSLTLDASAVARGGLMIRHLVMPGGVAESKRIVDFVVGELGADTYLNIMGQYRPAYRAREFSEINRRPARSEIANVISYARSLGMKRIES